MTQDFRKALQQEEKHLRVIREWYASLVMGESGKAKAAEKGTTRRK